MAIVVSQNVDRQEHGNEQERLPEGREEHLAPLIVSNEGFV